MSQEGGNSVRIEFTADHILWAGSKTDTHAHTPSIYTQRSIHPNICTHTLTQYTCTHTFTKTQIHMKSVVPKRDKRHLENKCLIISKIDFF